MSERIIVRNVKNLKYCYLYFTVQTVKRLQNAIARTCQPCYFIVSILVGVLGIILSICVKKYKMTSLIAGFNPKKHDEEKTATIVGDNIFLVGLVIIISAI